MVKRRAAGATDRGKNPDRPGNEDTFVVDEGFGLYVVCDGMGGHQAGEVASGMALAVFAHFVREGREACPDGMALAKSAVHAANMSVRAHARANRECDGMGTTIVALYCYGDQVVIAHVGDSRCYRLRGGLLECLTKDHSYVEEYGGDDPVARDLIRKSPYGHGITRSIGSSEASPDVRAEAVLVGDMFLLCSDGLNGMVEDDKIAEILALNPNPQDAVQALIQAALDAGGDDNVTVVVVTVEDAEGSVGGSPDLEVLVND